jgi:hypothetical protein
MMGRRRADIEPFSAYGKAVWRAMKQRGLSPVQVSDGTNRPGSPRYVSQQTLSRILSQQEDKAREDPHGSIRDAIKFSIGCDIDIIEASKENPVLHDLDRFRATPLGKSLGLNDEDLDDLSRHPWYDHDEHPTDEQWFDWIRLRRAVRTKKRGAKS